MQAHVAEGQLAERLVQRQRAAAFGLEGGIVEDGEYALGPGKAFCTFIFAPFRLLKGVYSMASAPMKAKNVPGVISPWMTSRPPYQMTSDAGAR